MREAPRDLTGGGRATEGALSKGFFVSPTVFAGVQDNMRIAQEEIFGPVISAIAFKDMDELVKRANNTTFGLGSGLWTRGPSALARGVGAGIVVQSAPLFAFDLAGSELYRR